MLDRELLEERMAELPLYQYFFIKPEQLEFADRVRWICENECPMYGQTWACPPGVGTVEECKKHCLSYGEILCVATMAEVDDIANIEQTLATRADHEEITNMVADLMEELGVKPFVLSTEACTLCERCAYLDGEPCRLPEKMHPCVESQGINVLPVLETHDMEFQYGSNVVTWLSMLLFSE